MTTPLIELEGVRKTYSAAKVDALRGVDLQIAGGEFVAITGPSGSGKSTLLNLLGLLDTLTAGRYLLMGRDTSQLTEREFTRLRASTLGFVFQSHHLVAHLSCLDNVALPLVHQGMRARQRVGLAHQALDTVGLSHRVHAKPPTLSGGEQQRTAIARAIVHDPPILLCDEPTGNLDTANTARVLDLLENLVTPQRSVVVVTHDLDVAKRAHHTITIVDGRRVTP